MIPKNFFEKKEREWRKDCSRVYAEDFEIDVNITLEVDIDLAEKIKQFLYDEKEWVRIKPEVFESRVISEKEYCDIFFGCEVFTPIVKHFEYGYDMFESPACEVPPDDDLDDLDDDPSSDSQITEGGENG